MKINYPGKYVKLCTLDDIYEGEAKLFEVGRYEILVLNVKGEIRAYYARCAHAFGLLEPSCYDGDGKIICPVHLWEYDAYSGRSINPTGSSLFPLDVKIEGDQIFVKVPDVNILEFKSKWFKMYSMKEVTNS